MGNFMKLCVLVLFQWLFLDQISFETVKKSKYNFNRKKILEIFFRENPGTNQNFITHALLCTANITS